MSEPIGRGAGDRVLVPPEREGQARGAAARRREAAPLVLRAFLAFFLIHMSRDEVFDPDSLDRYARQLFDAGMTFHPIIVAKVSAYLQFVSGIGLGLGLLTRLFALLVVLHFLGTIFVFHLYAPFDAWFVPCAMIAMGLFLWINGAGSVTLDRLIRRR